MARALVHAWLRRSAGARQVLGRLRLSMRQPAWPALLDPLARRRLARQAVSVHVSYLSGTPITENGGRDIYATAQNHGAALWDHLDDQRPSCRLKCEQVNLGWIQPHEHSRDRHAADQARTKIEEDGGATKISDGQLRSNDCLVEQHGASARHAICRVRGAYTDPPDALLNASCNFPDQGELDDVTKRHTRGRKLQLMLVGCCGADQILLRVVQRHLASRSGYELDRRAQRR